MMAVTDLAFERWKRQAAEADILAVAQRAPIGAKLKKKAREFVGPCPACGGTDRFSINPAKRVFNCRGAEGGDVIAMMMHVTKRPFVEACEIINGSPPPAADSQVDQVELEREAAERAAAAAAQLELRLAGENTYRQRERKIGYEIYARAAPWMGSSVDGYWVQRGLTLPPTPAGHVDRVRCVEQLPYWIDGSEIHRGPALVAPIVDAGRIFRGLHITYLDLAQPKGKLVLEHKDELVDAKKVRGSQLGFSIDLIGPAEPEQLVLGEGIEKTIAVHNGMAAAGVALERTGFRSAINLDNLGGPHLRTVRHPTDKDKAGRPRRVPGPEPDLGKPAIAIPDSVTDLVLLGDTTSDRFRVLCAITRAARRYARPSRTIRVAWAPPGKDFDDLLRGVAGEDRAIALSAIAAIVDQALPADVAIAELETMLSARGSAPHEKLSRRRQPARPHSSFSSTTSAAPPAAGEAPGSSDPPAAAASAAPSAARSSTKSASSQTGGSSRVSAGVRGGRGGRRDDDDPAVLDRRLAFFPLTDLGNAERFRERNRGRLIWCAAIGWFWWDGRRWSREGADERVKIAEHECVRGIQRESAAIEGTKADILIDTGKKEPVRFSVLIRRWGRTSESNSKLVPISKHAAAYLAVQPAQLDADPFAINVLNGTLYVGKLFPGYVDFREHDAGAYITKLAPVTYDPEAPRARFDQFIHEVQPNATSQRTLQQWAGYSLTGDVGEQKLAMFYGTGKNGKSVFEDVTSFVAGDYSESVPIETFLAEGRGRNAGQATPDLAILPGVRKLRTSEPKKGAALDEALIKLATGGEPILARHLNRDYFKYYPAFKLTISGNYRLRITGADEGIWRRIVLVPWPVQIAEAKRDPQLTVKLRGEASGILNWMLDGLRDWLDHGLTLGEDVAAATAEYRRDSDQLGRFIEACVEIAPGERVQSSKLHEVFNAWSKASSMNEWKGRSFSDAMTERGFKKDKSSVMYFLDIKLVKTVNDFLDHEGRPLKADAGAAASSQGGARGDDDLEF